MRQAWFVELALRWPLGSAAASCSGNMDSFNNGQWQVLEQLAGGVPLTELLDGVVRLVETHAAGVRCALLLSDWGEEPTNAGKRGRVPPECSPLVHALALRLTAVGSQSPVPEPIAIPDLARHPELSAHRELALRHELRAAYLAPIVSSGRVLGVFAMLFAEVGAPSEAEVAAVATATRLSAIALLRDRSLRDLRQSEARAQQLARLYSVSSGVNEGIARVREPQQLYDIACRIPVEQGLARVAWVGLYNELDDCLDPVARFGDDDGYVDSVTSSLRARKSHDGPAKRAIKSGSPSISNDIQSGPDVEWKHSALARGFRSCAVFPLRGKDRTTGVLAICSDQVGFFSEEEVRVLSALADDISFAVESAENERERSRVVGLLRIAGQAAQLGGWSMDVPDYAFTWSDEVCALHDLPAGTRSSLEQSLAAYAPQHREQFRSSLEACVRVGQPFDFEAELVTEAKHSVWVRVIGHAERRGDGAVSRVLGAVQDVSQRRQFEAGLRQSQKMEAIGQLAGGVAHDFNNLLSVILSYSELIADALKPDDPMRAEIEEVSKAATRAAELTRKLLAFGRQQVLQPRIVDLNLVLVGLEKMFDRVLGEAVTLSLLQSADLGKVLVDPGQVEQVLLNLIVNARDAMPLGGTLSIETSNVEWRDVPTPPGHEHAPGPCVLVTVTDSGLGMDAATRGRIFEPFFTTKDKGKGTGLGLATVWGIVTQSGGHVSVDSELGVGTTFRVYFPRKDGELDESPLPSPSMLPLRGSETILLVEDEEAVRALSRLVLRRYGYRVLEAQNGGEAFLICEQHRGRLELLVTDIVMPRMNGRVLAERLSVLRPEMKVLFVSGYAEGAFSTPDAAISESQFLAKPFTPEGLLRKVREVLDSATGRSVTS